MPRTISWTDWKALFINNLIAGGTGRKRVMQIKTFRPPLFYGWIIVGIAILGMTLIYGTRHSFSVFFPSILDEFGWSRGSTAIMLSLNLLVYGLVAPLAGTLGDRWKPRRVMVTGVVTVGLATAGLAFANELWQFYLLFGIIMPIGTAFCGWPLLAPALANWFSKRRGLAIAVGQVGGGISFTYGMFVEYTISRLSWRSAYFVVAGVLVAIIVPLYLFFFHYRPEDKGLQPYGSAEPTITRRLAAKTNEGNLPTRRDWTLGRAMRTYQLWLLVISQSLYWGIGTYVVLAHQVKFAEDMGYSSTFAASIFALFGVFMIIGQLSSAMSDWIGREKTVTLATILSISAVLALLSVEGAQQPWLLYVYAVGFGLGAGLYTPMGFVGAADIFHGKHFGAISGLLLTGMGVGGAFGPWLGGYIYDVTGSYTGAFILAIVCFVLASIAFWIAAPRNADRLRGQA